MSEKLGTCDTQQNHGVPHAQTKWCVNWREQPAQGEPRITVSHGAPPAATPMPEISAEQLDEKFAKKIFDETNITGGYSEWIPTIVAILREHAALKVRDLVKLNNTLATVNLTIRQSWEREVRELREELARAERFLETERNNHRVSILEWEQVEAENVRLREERDALKTTNQAREVTNGYILDMRLRAERAESALAEARDKALDEAVALYREHFYCAEYSDTSEAYLADLSKLKVKGEAEEK